MIREILLPFGPASAGPASQGPKPSARRNGIPVPTMASQLTSRRSSRVNGSRVSAPDRNISNSGPSQ